MKLVNGAHAGPAETCAAPRERLTPHHFPMTTYVYETIPDQPGKKPRQFEVRQSMHDAPLERHPETGERVKRVIAGGYGVIAQRAAPPPAPCGSQCACYGNN
ncbi:MAG: FmdB family zinc ribbon protein [Opitutaceae bacterium]